jgi:Flp pilus assembly protein TadG
MRRFFQRSRPDRCRAGRPKRRGAAAVELALCLPFLVTLTLGAIETCNLIYVRTRMNSVAYEGARVATRPATAGATAATSTAVTSHCNSLLSQLGVQGAQVSLQVLDYSTSQSKALSAAVPQDLVTVSVSAPLNQNCITMLVLSGSTSVTARATLVVE